mmetsp:Transcript_54655/g.125522  ORF Transcript_54655/g.125522 Transcript_54655/m.125522 type:complete len:200 (-) Transcript_54655:309-908(-)
MAPHVNHNIRSKRQIIRHRDIQFQRFVPAGSQGGPLRGGLCGLTGEVDADAGVAEGLDVRHGEVRGLGDKTTEDELLGGVVDWRFASVLALRLRPTGQGHQQQVRVHIGRRPVRPQLPPLRLLLPSDALLERDPQPRQTLGLRGATFAAPHDNTQVVDHAEVRGQVQVDLFEPPGAVPPGEGTVRALDPRGREGLGTQG